MTSRLFLFVLLTMITACGHEAAVGQVDGTIDGIVILTAPVGGVVVTAYPYDAQSGAVGAEIAHSDPTTPDGAFHLDLGIYFGRIALVARGSGGSYTEPATAAQVSWDAAQELRTAWFTWSPDGTLNFDFQRGDKQTGVIIGLWSELAFALAPAKQAAVSDGTFSSALEKALLLLRDHLEVDYWSVQPVDLTAGDARTWQAPVQAGLEIAGLSQLVSRMATDSSTGGLSSIDLLRALDRDAEDGLLDGRTTDGALTLGTCKQECQLSSDTLRSDFSDSMSLFLSSTSNHSTINASAVNDFLVRVATRQSELFPDAGMDTFDVTPPVITVVASTVVDEANGDATVPLTGDTTAVFGRLTADYGPDAGGLPRWRFDVEDDHSDDAHIDFEARLVNSDDQSVLVPWFAVPSISGSGYNREIVVSSALYADLATTGGNFQLDVEATDEKGNVSPITSVKWQQTIVPPPVPPPPPMPTIAVIDNTALDEGPLSISVTDNGPVYAGTPGIVTLTASSAPSFKRYSSHYGPNDTGIPKWHFLAQEMGGDVTVQARLVRSSDSTVLVPWFAVQPTNASGYNYEVVVSSALYSGIATRSGAYQLEVNATDTSGNVTPTVVAKWQQTILAAPIRQRTATVCDAGSDGQCAAHYSLQGNLDAAVPINGIGLPNALVRIGHIYIDNPNPVVVRVSVAPSASLVWSRGRRNWINPIVNPVSFTSGCQPVQTLDGSCYAFNHPGVEDVATSQTISALSTHVQVLINGSDPGPCSGCSTNERALPANATADVWFLTGPYTFLWSSYALGKLTNPNMPSTAIGSQAELFVSWLQQGTFQVFSQAWWYLTRISVTPTVRSTLQSRPDDSGAALAAAVGTNTWFFTATPSSWSTNAPGEASF